MQIISDTLTVWHGKQIRNAADEMAYVTQMVQGSVATLIGKA